MRFIKPILLGLSGLFIIIFLISLLMPSRITLVRSVMIQSEQSEVSKQITDLNNWKNWHPLMKGNCSSLAADEIRCSISGKDYRIRSIADTTGIYHFVMTSAENTDMHYRFFFNQATGNPGIELHWQVETRLKSYPWEKFSGIFFSEAAGPGYEQALQSLKAYCETNKVSP